MRIAIFADIHANQEALEAVLVDAASHKVTHHVCLGDVVGYNASPHECVDIIRNLKCPVIKGNHDEMASLQDDVTGFNPLAREAINWTREHLDAADKEWLRALPLVQQIHGFTVVHATLDSPHKWGYVFNQLDAAASFQYQETQICFYGHTHSPRVYIRDRSVRTAHLDQLRVEAGQHYMINVGSVGQPRDGDWHAAYCVYTPSDRLVELHRIEYDILKAGEKIKAAGLPQRLRDGR